MINVDLSNVTEAQDGEALRLPAGGYVCGITKVTNVPMDPYTLKGDYIKVEYDIAEGEYKNYWRSLYQKHDFWGGSFIRSYKPASLPFFKGFITCVTRSNPGYAWNGDENQLVRKYIGLVLGEEEYCANNGEIKTRLYVSAVKSVGDIRTNKYTVPPIKRLDDGAGRGTVYQNAPSVILDDDLPF